MLAEEREGTGPIVTKRHSRSPKPSVRLPAPRSEPEILDDLKLLCSQRGFAEAIAIACMRDDLIFYSGDEVTAKDMSPMFARSRLIRTEIATLLGYAVQAGEIPFMAPEREPLRLLEDAETLLEELHRRLSGRWFVDLPELMDVGGDIPPMGADAMREPIFYGGEAAFSFQYLDLAIEKYQSDNAWLLTNRGFRIEDAVATAKAIHERVIDGVNALHQLWSAEEIDRFSHVDPYRFSPEEIVARSGLEAKIVENVLAAFSLPAGPCNLGFQALGDFNEVNARPLVRHDELYYSFKHYALLEAIYESPFYWMGQDKLYLPTANTNRGQFTETFAYKRLVSVFGKDRVWRNVNLYRAKGERVGEIDVLVVLGDRAIIVQCKSKRLTLEARKGNDLALTRDFHCAFQHAYDQAILCAEHLIDAGVRLVTEEGEAVVLPHPIAKTLPLCLVADNYPALATQIEQFLKRRDVTGVLPTLFTDIFTLDAMAEMLDRPLYFLNYLELRARFCNKLSFSHEATLLSFHLKYNLWLDDKYDRVLLEDDFTADLEIAMLARRAGMPGAKTPKGILTAMTGTRFDALLRCVEERGEPALVDLGILLLQMSGDSAQMLNQGIEHAVGRALADFRLHDISLSFPPTGITVHCSYAPPSEAARRLEAHCTLRKYDTKAESWHGLWLNPADGLPRFGIKLEYPWLEDTYAAQAVRSLSLSGQKLGPGGRPMPRQKIGRNEPCPCGSGEKYKKCCLCKR